MALPDLLIIGSPKAGSTALHVALARHPQLFLSRPKEPKFFLTEGSPPDPAGQRGPGDAHSAQEWIWRRDRYEALFAAAPPGALRGESTPFYLWSRDAHRSMRRLVPEARLIAVVRDPIDRAYSNWTHLWCDGLETEPDFVTACARETERVARGYAPFWRYLEMGRYGEQLEHLYSVFPREQVFVLRYRRLIDEPARVLDEICRFLDIETGLLTDVPGSNVSTWVPNTPVNRALQRTVRAGAALGAHVPPQLWRQAQRPLLAALHRGGHRRPALSADDRRRLLPEVGADVRRLGAITGVDYSDWLTDTGRGAFLERRGGI